MNKQLNLRRSRPLSKQLILIVLVLSALFIPAARYGMMHSKPAPAESSGASPFVEPGNGRPMLVDLGSNNCIPCRAMQPILDELATEYKGRIMVQVVDVYEREYLTQRYGIYTIPTQIFFDAEGKELYRHEGFYEKAEIEAKFRELDLL